MFAGERRRGDPRPCSPQQFVTVPSPPARMGSRDRALAAVKIKAEDVEVIVREFELDAKTAERRLREHDGDLPATLAALIDEE